MPYLPFTICTEDYAKNGTASTYLYSCETDYPITNINNENRQSYAKYTAGAADEAGFIIDFGVSKSIQLVVIELSRPYIFYEDYTWYWNGAAWAALPAHTWYLNDTIHNSLPGQVKQYAVLKFTSPLSTQKLRFYFLDLYGVTQVEIRRVIACGIIDEFNGGDDFYAPAEQSHKNIGKTQVELIHGNKFRTQTYGALKQSKSLRFPQINPDQMKLLEDMESDYAVFGILDWTGRYLEGFIPPGGLTVNDNGVDAFNAPWFDVSMKFQEN